MMDLVLQSWLERQNSCGENSVKLGQKAATVDKRGESGQANKSRGLKQAGDSQKARRWSLKDAEAEENKGFKN